MTESGDWWLTIRQEHLNSSCFSSVANNLRTNTVSSVFLSSFSCRFSKNVWFHVIIPISIARILVLFAENVTVSRSSVHNWFTDDEPVRSAPKVTEAAGAKYIGLVILLVISLPIGALIIMDLMRIIRWVHQHHKLRKNRRLPWKYQRNIMTPRRRVDVDAVCRRQAQALKPLCPPLKCHKTHSNSTNYSDFRFLLIVL